MRSGHHGRMTIKGATVALDPDFASLIAPAQTPAAAPAVQPGLDPDFAALATGMPQAKAAAPTSSSALDIAKDYGSAAVRPIVKAITGLPGMAADATTTLGNLATGHINWNNASLGHPLSWLGQADSGAMQLPSTATNQLLDKYTRAPTNRVGKGAEIVSSMLAGSQIPMPQIGAQAPAGFTASQPLMKQAALQAAQEQGYVVAPSAGNPSFMNRLLGGIAGKQKVAQSAMTNNQAVTNRLAAQALGQNPDAPLTQGALSAIRTEAAQNGYAPVRAAGQMATDPKFMDTIDGLLKPAQGANRSFPGIKPQTSQLETTLGALKQDKFDAADGVDAIQHLRSLADDAFGSGQSTAGRAYKAAAKAVEDVIERNLQNRGEAGKPILDGFKSARELMAKTYSVGKALVGDSGDVSAPKLASQLAANKPLTGPLRTAANFATNYRNAARVPTENFESISPIDIHGSMIGAAAGHTALPFALPLTRAALQQYLLSPAGQARALRDISTGLPRQTMGLMGGAPIPAQSLLNNPSTP